MTYSIEEFSRFHPLFKMLIELKVIKRYDMHVTYDHVTVPGKPTAMSVEVNL